MGGLSRGTRPSVIRIWGWPLVLAGLSLFGLLSALLGQGGIWWPLSWIALATPLMVILRCLWKRPSRTLVPELWVLAIIMLLPAAARAQVRNIAGIGLLTADLSPWSMFLGADILVKLVMIGLALASAATWTMCLLKTLELAAARRGLKEAFRVICEARTPGGAAEKPGRGDGVAGALLRPASAEWQQSADALDDREGLKEPFHATLAPLEQTKKIL